MYTNNTEETTCSGKVQNMSVTHGFFFFFFSPLISISDWSGQGKLKTPLSGNKYFPSKGHVCLHVLEVLMFPQIRKMASTITTKEEEQEGRLNMSLRLDVPDVLYSQALTLVYVSLISRWYILSSRTNLKYRLQSVNLCLSFTKLKSMTRSTLQM